MIDNTKVQIGCGYCVHERQCKDRVKTINKAKTCVNFQHHTEAKINTKPNYRNNESR